MLHATILFPAVAGTPTYILNSQSSLNLNFTGGDPYYISVDSVDGLNSSDISFETHPIPNDTGEKSGDVFRRGKSVTLSGTIWGKNIGGLAIGAEYLSEVFWDTSMRKLYWYPLVASSQVYLNCRVFNDLSVAQIKPQERNYRWLWTVGLRADDPKIYNAVGDAVYRSWMT